jgi:hypothetical protein
MINSERYSSLALALAIATGKWPGANGKWQIVEVFLQLL